MLSHTNPDESRLNEWRNWMGEDAARVELRRCQDRGTRLHAALECLMCNEPVGEIDPLTKRLLTTLRFQLRKIDNIRLQEAALWSDTLELAGRIDLLAEYRGKLSVIDFKTSTRTKSAADVHSYFLQTTAYALMVEERYDIHVPQVVVLCATEASSVPLAFIASPTTYYHDLIRRNALFPRDAK